MSDTNNTQPDANATAGLPATQQQATTTGGMVAGQATIVPDHPVPGVYYPYLYDQTTGYISTNLGPEYDVAFPCGCRVKGQQWQIPAVCPFHPDAKEEKTAKTEVLDIVVNIILDESSSMNSCLDQTISGFNEYIDTLREKDSNYLVSLTKFNTEAGVTEVYSLKPIKDVPRLDKLCYSPSGGTPLCDAVGVTVSKVEGYCGSRPVLTVIFTDGEENASREWNKAKIKALTARLEATGKWTFVYLGADQNAWRNARQYGVAAGNAVSYNSASTQSTFRAFAGQTQSYTTSMRAASASGSNVLRTNNFFSGSKAEPSDLSNTPQALGGLGRAAKLDADERREQARKAANARWGLPGDGKVLRATRPTDKKKK